jgi:hypothetical protein
MHMSSHRKRPAKRGEKVAKLSVAIEHTWQLSADSGVKLGVKRRHETNKAESLPIAKT